MNSDYEVDESFSMTFEPPVYDEVLSEENNTYEPMDQLENVDINKVNVHQTFLIYLVLFLRHCFLDFASSLKDYLYIYYIYTFFLCLFVM